MYIFFISLGKMVPLTKCCTWLSKKTKFYVGMYKELGHYA
jgi:hypothetical protein